MSHMFVCAHVFVYIEKFQVFEIQHGDSEVMVSRDDEEATSASSGSGRFFERPPLKHETIRLR